MNFKKLDYKSWLIAVFILLYSLFIFFVDYTFDHYAEILGATVFFFALFAGFFISRQNDRFSEVTEVIAETDGLFSYLYRVSGFVPSIQERVREITRNHYEKILKSGNWAYQVLNPSTTITELTQAFGKLNDKENEELANSPVMGGVNEIIWDVLRDLQLKRKKMLSLYNARLLVFQWIIVYLLAFLLIVTFNFIPTPEGLIVDVLKIFFGTAVFMVIILLKQLNDLSLFGPEFTKKTVKDVLRIIEEKDVQESKQK